MDHIQLVDSLESAIQVWRNPPDLSNDPLARTSSEESSRKMLLAAARSLITALEVPGNILAQISKMVRKIGSTHNLEYSAECGADFILASRACGAENRAQAKHLRTLGKRSNKKCE